MSVSKEWTSKPEWIKEVLERYKRPGCPRIKDIALEMRTTEHNVQYVLRTHLPSHEFSAMKKVRHSVAKMGDKNPMKGRSGSLHHNYIGLCDDGYGYLTVKVGKVRKFVHRIVMAEALGLTDLPKKFAVHHIDGDKKNNSLDNLAICTNAGHSVLHDLQKDLSVKLQLKRSTLWDAVQCMTSQSK